MPSALTDNRVTLDETSLDFRQLDASELEEHLDMLNEVLDALHQQGIKVRVHPWLWDSIECLDGCLICDFVYRPGTTAVSPDTLRLLGLHLDRCPTWCEDEQGFPDSVESIEIAPTDEETVAKVTTLEPAFSVGIGLSPARRRDIACLVFGACSRRGFWAPYRPATDGQAFFFATHDQLPLFWRSLFAREKVAEEDFALLAGYAFPNLILHPDLDFSRFDGHYRDLRDKVASVLGTINDHLPGMLVEHSGLPDRVASALGRFGVDLSPESPNTRGSPRLMALRDVTLAGRTHRCEWHAKLEPTRNRIHFTLPVKELDGRILVGIFTAHLPT